MNLPTHIKIFDSDYDIKYFDAYVEVDPRHRDLMEGCMDYELSEIRIYRNQRSYSDILETIIHEALHAIGQKLNIECLENDDTKSDAVVDIIAVAINTILVDNNHIWEIQKQETSIDD